MNTREMARKLSTMSGTDVDTVYNVLHSLSEVACSILAKGDSVIIPGLVKLVPTFVPSYKKSVPFKSKEKLIIADAWKVRCITHNRVHESLKDLT